MISDRVFKSLKHKYKDYEVFTKGEEVEKGYKPDFVLCKTNNYVILESENSSSRKTFVGGLLKASHFLRFEKTGILIFVILPKKNTRAQSIARHLLNYFTFIKPLTNLSKVYVIEAEKYYYENEVLEILEKDFINCCFQVE